MRLHLVHVAVQRTGVEAVLAAATSSRIATSRLRLQKMMAFLTSLGADQLAQHLALLPVLGRTGSSGRAA